MSSTQSNDMICEHSSESSMPSQANATSTSKLNPTTLHEAMGGLEGPSSGIDPSEDEETVRLNEEARVRKEKERDEITLAALEAFGIRIDTSIASSRDEKQGSSSKSSQRRPRTIINVRKDFFRDLSNFPELNVEVAGHLKLHDFVSLYAISKDFHYAVNAQLTTVLVNLSHRLAPESAQIFRFNFYDQLCTEDPMKNPHPSKPNTVRRVPSIRWLRMVVYREKTIRDILACMAREGHRMPKGMSMSLKKMWLLMDIATTRQRVMFMHGRTWTNTDLYNVQMFVVKLDMRCNDPVEGPGGDHMRKLFLGQKSLGPLCRLLKRQEYTTSEDILKLAVRYSHTVRPEHRGYSIWGIHPAEIGIDHLEGWGKGRSHLMRPDELVVRESVRRGMGLKHHIMMMMLWGYVDPVTTLNTPPTAEEKYMSDDEDNINPKLSVDEDSDDGAAGQDADVAMPDVSG